MSSTAEDETRREPGHQGEDCVMQPSAVTLLCALVTTPLVVGAFSPSVLLSVARGTGRLDEARLAVEEVRPRRPAC